jgi:multimeric flavodoxin WrbA
MGCRVIIIIIIIIITCREYRIHSDEGCFRCKKWKGWNIDNLFELEM